MPKFLVDYFPIIIGVIVFILIFISCLKIVPQGNAYVIERLGKYKTTWYAGMHFKMPIIDKVVRRISMKEQVADFESQRVITKDNVTNQKIYSV